MELDEWKDIWQAEHREQPSDDVQLRAMLNKRSACPVAKMKRNLLVELWIVIITYSISIVFYFFAWKGRMSEVAWFMLIVGALFVVYYLRKNRLLRQMETNDTQLKNKLRLQISTLENFVRFYLIAGMVLIPVSMIFFGWIFYQNARYISETNIFFPSGVNPFWKAALAWFILLSVVTLLLAFLNRWYMRKLYGRHIEKLKSILREMEEG